MKASFTVAQSATGHAELAGRLRALKPAPTLIVLEATGVYYLDAAVVLARAGLALSVINPKSFHHFAKAKLSHAKTDRLDAALLAEYGERMQPAVWLVPDMTRMALRDIGRQINRLTHDSVRSKNRLHALVSKSFTPSLLIKDEKAAIVAIDKRIKTLTTAALALIKPCPVLSGELAHLDAAVGVAQASAIAILAELCVLPRSMRANQLSRHAGLDVRVQQSGSSVNKPAHLSKAGNAYLRAALYMPALSACSHDPLVRAFYESLQSRGKKKLQALCAVMRKYLTGFWACLKNDQPFDSSKLFSPIHLQSA